MAAGSFQLIGHIRVLAAAKVDYIIVGGVSGWLQGSPYPTGDLDIVPELSPENLARLATALSTPQTVKWGATSTASEPHPIVEPAEFKTEAIASYSTSDGRIDVLQEIPDAGGYDELKRNALSYSLSDAGVTLWLASLDDVIASKLAAGRSKDFYTLPGLREAQARLKETPDDYELSVDRLSIPPVGPTFPTRSED